VPNSVDGRNIPPPACSAPHIIIHKFVRHIVHDTHCTSISSQEFSARTRSTSRPLRQNDEQDDNREEEAAPEDVDEPGALQGRRIAARKHGSAPTWAAANTDSVADSRSTPVEYQHIRSPNRLVAAGHRAERLGEQRASAHEPTWETDDVSTRKQDGRVPFHNQRLRTHAREPGGAGRMERDPKVREPLQKQRGAGLRTAQSQLVQNPALLLRVWRNSEAGFTVTPPSTLGMISSCILLLPGHVHEGPELHPVCALHNQCFTTVRGAAETRPSAGPLPARPAKPVPAGCSGDAGKLIPLAQAGARTDDGVGNGLAADGALLPRQRGFTHRVRRVWQREPGRKDTIDGTQQDVPSPLMLSAKRAVDARHPRPEPVEQLLVELDVDVQRQLQHTGPAYPVTTATKGD
jgi:hypothetical protein